MRAVEGIFVEEKSYINQEFSQVIVSFQLSALDWNLLEITPEWNSVE